MKDVDLLSFKLKNAGNNERSQVLINRIDHLHHSMDKEGFVNDYKKINESYFPQFSDDIECGDIDLEMYENWLTK